MKEEGLLRESLDSNSIAFSMLTLCKSVIGRETIRKLNANFCLGNRPINSSARGITLLSKVIWQQNLQADRFVSAKREKPRRSLSRSAAARTGKNARSSSVRNNSPRFGREPLDEDCARCATKFPGKI